MIDLALRWAEKTRAAGLSDPGMLIWDALVFHYTDPWRSYHNVDHLAFVLTGLDVIAEEVPIDPRDDRYTTEFAAWFHDVSRSEDESAAYAVMCLEKMGMSGPDLSHVAHLITTTRTHVYEEQDTAAAWLCDADLGVLALPWEEYKGYVRRVRAEYRDVSNADWALGRSKVLHSFLDRERIYGLLPEEAELRARKNIRTELESLRI